MVRYVVLIMAALSFVCFINVLPVQAQDSETNSERIARLEEAYKYLATKEDIAELRGEFAELRGELRGMQWMLGGGFLVVIAVTLWVNRERRPNLQQETSALTNPQMR